MRTTATLYNQLKNTKFEHLMASKNPSSKRTADAMDLASSSKKGKQASAGGAAAALKPAALVEQPNFRPSSLKCAVTKDGLGWSQRKGWTVISVNTEGYWVGKHPKAQYFPPIPMTDGVHTANFAIVESISSNTAIGIMSGPPGFTWFGMQESGHCWKNAARSSPGRTLKLFWRCSAATCATSRCQSSRKVMQVSLTEHWHRLRFPPVRCPLSKSAGGTVLFCSAPGDIVGMELDFDAGTLTAFKNGEEVAVIAADLKKNGPYYWVVELGQDGEAVRISVPDKNRARPWPLLF